MAQPCYDSPTGTAWQAIIMPGVTGGRSDGSAARGSRGCVSMRAALRRKVSVPGEGSREREKLRVERFRRRGERNKKKAKALTHPLVNQTPKGCATQDRVIA